MVEQPKAVSRRRFLESSSAVALLTALGEHVCAADPPSGTIHPKRISLAEPGPMLPPVPAILLTVKGKRDGSDEISVVWTFVVNGKPPQIGVSVHDRHVAGMLIKEHGEFVLNVPTAEIVKPFDTVDMNTGKIADKFALSGLTRERATKVDAPTVAESPIHVECRVFDTIPVPPVRSIFLASVVATTVREGVCDESGRLIVPAVQFFGMTAGSGEFYTMGRKVGHIGQTVGRTDIKY